MSGVWKFNPNGVLNLVDNPLAASSCPGPCSGTKILVHSASNETMSSYEQLDAKLLELGWHAYSRNQFIRQYHRSYYTSDLITLPELSFGSIRTTHMYDIVVKTRSAFQVRDA
ncbi:hypothetical protein KC19_2G160600 [Ceratodon purpureus]|uniref:Uncharacterized protein n=1 Tax=Ceratodon purpureus TaxID=3225 RepID=A0A8T0IW90_CERPU|nr:hypothetical protein KC19_2G160600 [Ceratodon purpureus]